jgi:hypothetical protein
VNALSLLPPTLVTPDFVASVAVPHVLADDCVHGVEDTVVHAEVADLVLLAARLRDDVVPAAQGAGAVLGTMIGLTWLAQPSGSASQCCSAAARSPVSTYQP